MYSGVLKLICLIIYLVNFCGNGKKIFLQGNNINRITEKGVAEYAECWQAKLCTYEMNLF